MPATLSGLSGQRNARLLIIVVITLGSFIIDIFGQIHGIAIFAPLLFFLPIILAAYWYPKQGVFFAVGIGILQLLLVSENNFPDLGPLTYATATASFYVLVAVGVVVSALSGNLKEQETRYYAIFDHSEAGMILVHGDADRWYIDEINRRGAELLGFLSSDLKGYDLKKIWEDDLNFELLKIQVGKGVNSSDIESSFLTRDGSDLPVLISAARFPGNRLVITFMDITMRKKADKEIRRRNTQLTTINQIIAITSTATGVDDLMKRSFEKLQDLFPIDAGAVYLFDQEHRRLESRFVHGTEQSLVVLQDHIMAASPTFNNAVLSGRSEYGIFMKKMGLPVEPQKMSAAIPIMCVDDIIGVLFLVRKNDSPFDPDDKAVLEAIGKEIGCTISKLRLSESLVDANRKANLYLDILVHDINNANLAALGYGDLLLEMTSGRPREMAQKMIEGVLKSREIIRNLETIRHLQERKTEIKPVNLNTIVSQEIRHFPASRIDYEGSDVVVLADGLLAETITNLIGNSVKFGGPDTHITIQVHELPDGFIEVSIVDTGPGIPDELKPVIFNRFQVGSSGGSGKGLGLYIAKTLIERYDGRIWVEDRIPGDFSQGAVIKFTLRKYQGPVNSA
ncbi:MAG TPA: ATP-binding protein [Methanoregulaceae archaeon]|nr:ATP-binding protein [Methanoregulaceae archaeon]